MNLHIPLTPSAIDPAAPVIDLPNQAGWIRGAFEGADGKALIQAELDILTADPTNAASYMNLGVLYQLISRKTEALACQDAALLHARAFRQPPFPAAPSSFTLLVFVARGDLMTNTPIELLLEGRPVSVVRLYVDPDLPLPTAVPEHDLAMVAISESDQTRALLERLAGLAWPRPVLNDAAAILDLARDRLWTKLEGIAGLVLPPTLRAPRAQAPALAAQLALSKGQPLLIRPVGSHAGQGLMRLEDVQTLDAYLSVSTADVFYLTPFVDYAGPDERYRKYRIAVFDGKPHLAHMAVGEHWMVHYLNAGMGESAAKRVEEAAAMASFDYDFAVRHAGALAEISQRLGLDYYALDCAETPDGRLLVFEADVAMIVHALDPAEVYPYKPMQMRKIFAAFEAMLRAKASAE
jgi:glutathione synthase/RimK-type ligase-like ATP-grasp enzyme